MNYLARLSLGQPAVCPRAIWTRANSLYVHVPFFSRSDVHTVCVHFFLCGWPSGLRLFSIEGTASTAVLFTLTSWVWSPDFKCDAASDKLELRAPKKSLIWASLGRREKTPHPQDKIQHLDFTKDRRPLYNKTPPCVFYHKNVRSFLSKAEILGVGVFPPLQILLSSKIRIPRSRICLPN